MNYMVCGRYCVRSVKRSIQTKVRKCEIVKTSTEQPNKFKKLVLIIVKHSLINC